MEKQYMSLQATDIVVQNSKPSINTEVRINAFKTYWKYPIRGKNCVST